MTELSRDDCAWLHQRREYWVALAVSTQPCDRDAAAAAIREWYRQARLDLPEVIWAESPGHAQAIRQRLRQVAGRSVLGRLWPDAQAAVGDWPVPDQLRWQIELALQGSGRPRCQAEAASQIWSDAQRPGLPSIPLPHTLSAFCDLEQIMRWDAYLELGETDDPGVWAALRVLSEVGLVLPFDDLAIAIERPGWLGLDDEFWPHHSFYPAVRWADGQRLNYWHGTLLPEQFWDRRAAHCADQPGPNDLEPYCAEAAWQADDQIAQIVGRGCDPADPGQVIKLVALLMPGREYPELHHYLWVSNGASTADGSCTEIVVEVPPTTADPIEALAASFGLTIEQYRQLQRAT